MIRFMLIVLFTFLHVSALFAEDAGEPDSTVRVADRAYQLKVGDLVRVEFYGEPDLKREFRVSEDGTANFIFIGKVDTKGLTIEQLESMLEERYKDGYLKKPQVDVTIVEYRAFYVNGAVSRAGPYKFVDGLTVRKAIALAGGLNERGTWDKVYLKREDAEEELRVNDSSLSIAIKPGDIITVGETLF